MPDFLKWTPYSSFAFAQLLCSDGVLSVAPLYESEQSHHEYKPVEQREIARHLSRLDAYQRTEHHIKCQIPHLL